MTVHTLPAGRGTVLQSFNRSVPPVLEVDPGDTVMVSSLDASGHLEAPTSPGEAKPLMFPDRLGHCLTGPIAVRGAVPGDVLAVSFTALTPGEWGWTIAGHRRDALARALGMEEAEPQWLLWDLDPGRGTGVNQLGHTVGLSPFLGVVGMPPNEPGDFPTVPPRAAGGGNIDCRELTAGSVLYLPVTVPGAMLCVGDGHARQGDGEVGGTAIECPMTSELELDLAEDPALQSIHAVTPTARITFGFDSDLNAASAEALGAMLTWMEALYGLDRTKALALASTVVDLRVTQMANEVWGVHAVLGRDALR
ncbi:acetamidase [Arthrobacter frigidicola]|nr:acetamidase [Arthrobacter frigidicola]